MYIMSVLIKGGNLDPETKMREDYVKAQGEWHLEAKDCPRLPEASKDAQNKFSLETLRRNQL